MLIFVDGGVTLFEPPPPTVRLDRPFLLCIRDDTTGLVLYLGRVEDPTES